MLMTIDIIAVDVGKVQSGAKAQITLEDLLTMPVKIADLGNACWTVSNSSNAYLNT